MQPVRAQDQEPTDLDRSLLLSHPSGDLEKSLSPRSSFAPLTQEDIGGPARRSAMRSTKLHLSGGDGFLGKLKAGVSHRSWAKPSQATARGAVTAHARALRLWLLLSLNFYPISATTTLCHNDHPQPRLTDEKAEFHHTFHK